MEKNSRNVTERQTLPACFRKIQIKLNFQIYI